MADDDLMALGELILSQYRLDLARQVPEKAPVPKAPERYKAGTRRVPHTPRGMGPRKTWAAT